MKGKSGPWRRRGLEAGKLLGVLLLNACATVPNSAAPRRAAETPPKLRLPGAARPVSYDLDLTILPEKDVFSGAIEVNLELPEPTRIVWLNATDLKVAKAVIATEKKRRSARIVPGGEDFVGFAFDKPIGPGRARLRLSFTGKVSATSTTGIFRQKAGEDWYAFTQFEATDARRAFPCFDEPAYKVPWRVTLRVPKSDLAVSNTPVASEEQLARDLKAVHFAETKPLPSYLVAFGVGPFEVVDAGRAGKNATPIRMIVPKGRREEARHAAQTTGPLLELLEDYFGIPYPYPKLDNLVIPQTVRFGAMENAGLVTYNESILLAKPEQETALYRLRWASVCAHETAHQWFGDLVTLAWWNDTWLNESFATWMSEKVLEQWKPEWNMPARRVISRAETMRGDTLVAARKIRQPIESKGDIDNAFDNISYGKGSAVLSMFEAWVGVKKFQSGVRRYLTAHAHGNATGEDFLGTLEAEGGDGLAQAFSSFLDQAGAPLITLRLSCSAGALPSLVVSQRRLLPEGSPPVSAQVWSIPLCVRYGGPGWSERSCDLVKSREAQWALPSVRGCPGWVLGNDGEHGYYGVLYESDLLGGLLAGGAPELTLPERVGVLEDVATLARTGQMSWAKALELVPEFAGDGDPHLVSATVRIALGIDERLVSDQQRVNYERFIRKFFGARARHLGWNPKPDEDEETQLMRPSLMRLVARAGRDPDLRAEARSLALAWLEDSKATGADILGTVLAVAAEDGDRVLFEKFRAYARNVSDRQDRRRLLAALGLFRDPALEKGALGILLTQEFDIRESFVIFSAAMSQRSTHDLAWEFFKQNFDSLLARLPQEMGATLPRVGRSFCDAVLRADIETFFRERIGRLVGAQRPLAETLEAIDQCLALKADQEKGVSEFLSKY